MYGSGLLTRSMRRHHADLQPGEVSEISRQPFGCNILKLVERTKYEPVTFEQVREAL